MLARKLFSQPVKLLLNSHRHGSLHAVLVAYAFLLYGKRKFLSHCFVEVRGKTEDHAHLVTTNI